MFIIIVFFQKLTTTTWLSCSPGSPRGFYSLWKRGGWGTLSSTNRPGVAGAPGHMSRFFYGASRWRVCYQQGLTILHLSHINRSIRNSRCDFRRHVGITVSENQFETYDNFLPHRDLHFLLTLLEPRGETRWLFPLLYQLVGQYGLQGIHQTSPISKE